MTRAASAALSYWRIKNLLFAFETKVPVGVLRRQTAARRALDKALLDQKRFNHVFDGFALFTDRRRQVIQPDWPPVNLSIIASSSLRSI